MKPTLARYIRLARNHIYGTPLDLEDEKRTLALQEFQVFLARKIELDLRFELFWGAIWTWTPEGCSLEFSVDNRQFALQQTGTQHGLSLRLQEMNTLLITLADNEQFQDQLLIAIDDVLQKGNPT